MYGRYRILRQRGNGLLNDPNLVMYRTIRLNDSKLFEGERGMHVPISNNRVLRLHVRPNDGMFEPLNMMVIPFQRNGILRR